jgi:hypothetical protein
LRNARQLSFKVPQPFAAPQICLEENMAAPSQRPIARKLGIKSGNRVAVLHAPKGYTSTLGKVPADASLTTRLAGESFDLVQAFYEDQRTLKVDLPKLKKAIHPMGKIWVCWRKGNVTDLNRDSIWRSVKRLVLIPLHQLRLMVNGQRLNSCSPNRRGRHQRAGNEGFMH